MKNFSKIIREFEKSPYKSYESRRPKHQPTDRYVHLARHLTKCIIRADALNSHVFPVITEKTDTKQILILHVCSKYESK